MSEKVEASEPMKDDPVAPTQAVTDEPMETEDTVPKDSDAVTNDTATAVAATAAAVVEKPPAENIATLTTTAPKAEVSWDHSNRRVVVHNVLKFLDNKAMKKLTTGWIQNFKKKYPDTPMEFEKTKKPPRDVFGVITFQSEAMCQPFVDFINEGNFNNKKGGKITAKLALETASGKRHRDDDDDDDDRGGGNQQSSKRSRDVSAARRHVTEEEIKDKITPLWRLSKKEQQTKKIRDMAKHCARKISSDLKNRFRQLAREKSRKKKIELYSWLDRKRCIDMAPIVSAPTPLRNKSEFTFGYRYLFDETRKKEESEKKEGEGGPEKLEVPEDGDASKDEVMKESDGLKEEVSKEGETKDGDASKDESVKDSGPLKRNAPKEGESSSEEVAPKEPAKVPAVGFMVTGWAGGVSRPHCCENIPPEVCTIVEIVDEFLATSPLPPYDVKSHQGFWRTLTIRSSRRTQECMIIIMHTPAEGGIGDKQVEGSDHKEHFEKERARLVSVLTEAELPIPDQAPLKVTSIFFQEFDGLSHPGPEHPVQHVYGKEYLTEKLGKCSFQISPGAFFQVNTEGAEMLYQIAVDKVREVSKEPENTLLFDVCCGTGTIGLTCMKEGAVGRVVGVDISQPAIEDAKRNAVLNGYEDGNSEDADQKTRFVAARAEHVLHKEIAKAKDGDMQFVALVDPAREGLHPDVIKTLRSNERIQRVVYVSCNPTATLTRDASLFCQPPTKKYSGLPFRVSSAALVDMFPLTDHCEMVMTFDRMTAEEAGEES